MFQPIKLYIHMRLGMTISLILRWHTLHGQVIIFSECAQIHKAGENKGCGQKLACGLKCTNTITTKGISSHLRWQEGMQCNNHTIKILRQSYKIEVLPITMGMAHEFIVSRLIDRSTICNYVHALSMPSTAE